MEKGTFEIKVGLAEMLKGGVIMDVTNAEQAKMAEDAGAVAVMALERIPADIRKDGGIARMSDPELIYGIQKTVSIPVMAKCRIGHFAEAQILQSLEIDFIDESEVLTPADENNHIYKHDFRAPFVCGARNLGEALRRIAEGAAMIRTKGEAGSGNIVEAVRHMRTITNNIKRLTTMDNDQLMAEARDMQAPFSLVQQVAKTGKLEVRGDRKIMVLYNGKTIDYKNGKISEFKFTKTDFNITRFGSKSTTDQKTQENSTLELIKCALFFKNVNKNFNI
ncbi:MAG: hypothetical protein HOG97_00780, partial [Candidatus Marinimicrobia bacterium]|nr:hypothetical protein [Candidatus Neomarinimicrobiota bacterium]